MLLAEAGHPRRAAPRSRTTARSRTCEAFGADVQEGARFVDDGDIMTAAGVTSGIDLALHIVRTTLGEDAAQAEAARDRVGRSALPPDPPSGQSSAASASGRSIGTNA